MGFTASIKAVFQRMFKRADKHCHRKPVPFRPKVLHPRPYRRRGADEPLLRPEGLLENVDTLQIRESRYQGGGRDDEHVLESREHFTASGCRRDKYRGVSSDPSVAKTTNTRKTHPQNPRGHSCGAMMGNQLPPATHPTTQRTSLSPPLRRKPNFHQGTQIRPLPPLLPPQQHHPPSPHALPDLDKPLPSLPHSTFQPAAGTGEGAARRPTPDFTALLDTLHATLSHTRYAVCGQAALYLHGFPSASPLSHVSIMCPASGRDIIFAWGGAAGWDVPSRRHRRARRFGPVPRSSDISRALPPGGDGDMREDEIGVAVPGGRVWKVGIRCVDEEMWDGVVKGAVPSGGEGGGEVNVVRLEGLLDQLARAWGRSCEGEWAVGLMMWVLERLEESGRKVAPESVPHVVDETFWLPFTLSYPEAVPLLGRCGLQGSVQETFASSSPDTAAINTSYLLADEKHHEKSDELG
ncbi:hypothetical protein B0T25DRAFT_524313 [Lasiosphaeria hispida]|uniref:Uncharacterized protein n=1 Tax=Lasiosphaeria hispida TaxID=260671 RepID=A0AAJ0HT69_9PEZI|nr:hypothetical protein B0T25DRAFT_524313 [Lasiosphaeria hispida]